ncbi:hypothetical protein N7478_013043 [Penicillium angulare]|uniref:uncharacterized protein n=1 Tax=Penicillium angulare TaxID=116970 RepID=UPI0025401976|nr:uncharacterized protein N7478_013043 [Penicillium angulare]KAJ5256939.1 hypothetical protein N7478_013043 [Penicillium angulare]
MARLHPSPAEHESQLLVQYLGSSFKLEASVDGVKISNRLGASETVRAILQTRRIQARASVLEEPKKFRPNAFNFREGPARNLQRLQATFA